MEELKNNGNANIAQIHLGSNSNCEQIKLAKLFHWVVECKSRLYSLQERMDAMSINVWCHPFDTQWARPVNFRKIGTQPLILLKCNEQINGASTDMVYKNCNRSQCLASDCYKKIEQPCKSFTQIDTNYTIQNIIAAINLAEAIKLTQLPQNKWYVVNESFFAFLLYMVLFVLFTSRFCNMCIGRCKSWLTI